MTNTNDDFIMLFSSCITKDDVLRINNYLLKGANERKFKSFQPTNLAYELKRLNIQWDLSTLDENVWTAIANLFNSLQDIVKYEKPYKIEVHGWRIPYSLKNTDTPIPIVPLEQTVWNEKRSNSWFDITLN